MDQAPVANVAAVAAPIIGGDYTDDYRGVGAILNVDSGFGCTTEVVGPRLVLTAAHCFGYEDSYEPRALDIAGASPIMLAVHSLGSGPGRGDLAIGLLDRDMPLAYEIGTSLPNDGDEVEAVGYGCTAHHWEDGILVDDEPGAFKRAASAHFDGSGPKLQEDVGCHGDSGGPVFDSDNRIVGVISYASQSDPIQTYVADPTGLGALDGYICTPGDTRVTQCQIDESGTGSHWTCSSSYYWEETLHDCFHMGAG